MKSKAKTKIIIIFTLGIVFGLSLFFITNNNLSQINNDTSSKYSDNSNFDNKNLKISADSEKIHIDNNWTDAKAAGICTGSGNYIHPYIIEDLIIDSGGSGSGIRIENSDFYFRIENCTLYNSEWNYPLYGIKLSNVNNSLIIMNKCSSNYYGVHLSGCYNNTILENTIENNRYGISLFFQ